MSDVMAGIRILEVAEHTFVPAASAVLADWGAEVIKIEHAVRGDAMRGLRNVGTVGFGGEVEVLVEHSNRGKKSLGLDLARPEGLEILYRLAAISDVFLTNKMPAVREKLRIDVDDIRAHNPNIVYVRGSGYGARGPDADAGGYDFLAYWARSGVAMGMQQPELDRVLAPPSPAYGDSIGAMTIAGGIAAALLHRERTGEADVVDVSLLATGMWAIGGGIAIAQTQGHMWTQLPTDRGMGNNPLVGIYETADGKYVALSMLQGFHYWPEMCDRLGLGELVRDPRFDSFEHFGTNSAEAVALVAAALRARTLAEWKERFHGMKGQWSPVQDMLDIVDDPQVGANGYLQDLETSAGLPFTLVSTPVQFNDAPAPARRAPEFNEHGDELLTGELGMDWDTIIDLKVKGVLA